MRVESFLAPEFKPVMVSFTFETREEAEELLAVASLRRNTNYPGIVGEFNSLLAAELEEALS